MVSQLIIYLYFVLSVSVSLALFIILNVSYVLLFLQLVLDSAH